MPRAGRGAAVILDLFAGPGGWDTGLRGLGLDTLGVEVDHDANLTARAAGHRRHAGDVARVLPTSYTGVEGIVASPPCGPFSTAGTNRGRDDITTLVAVGSGRLSRTEVTVSDADSLLAVEPLRWVLALRPRWTAWEQAPAVAGFWRSCAVVLREAGYRTLVTEVRAEEYGLPQVRERAYLLAHLERQPVHPPTTHSAYYPRDPTRLDAGVHPWVTMGRALDLDEGWLRLRRVGQPPAVADWPMRRPATTVTTRERVPHPGGNAGHGREGKSRNDGYRITLTEAATLQGFPRGYPFHGSIRSRQRQIGNAVPPPVAAAVVSSLL